VFLTLKKLQLPQRGTKIFVQDTVTHILEQHRISILDLEVILLQ
jgi:hypothetical protein